mgnify:CR=1 FL=1
MLRSDYLAGFRKLCFLNLYATFSQILKGLERERWVGTWKIRGDGRDNEGERSDGETKWNNQLKREILK